ncbi:hypothetical protein HN011_011645 [Eciton burchellii]|nr:hypothetical protein HN011_011645 [Eciton burchellii]
MVMRVIDQGRASPRLAEILMVKFTRKNCATHPLSLGIATPHSGGRCWPLPLNGLTRFLHASSLGIRAASFSKQLENSICRPDESARQHSLIFEVSKAG